MKHRAGFTVIELLFIVVLLGAASVLFFIQKHNVDVVAQDNQRKTAINAMYYSLEEVYYKEHGNYPRTLTKSTLPSVDPELFVDPNGVELNQTTVTVEDQEYPVTPNYRYEGTNCENDACKSYTLRTTLQNEDDFVRESRHK